MEEAPENGKESSNSAHGNGMNEWKSGSGVRFPLSPSILYTIYHSSNAAEKGKFVNFMSY